MTSTTSSATTLAEILTEQERHEIITALSAMVRARGGVFYLDEAIQFLGEDAWVRYWRTLAEAAGREDLVARFPNRPDSDAGSRVPLPLLQGRSATLRGAP